MQSLAYLVDVTTNDNVQWSGIFLSWASEVFGIKNKIEKSFVIKEHFEVSVSYDPLTVNS